MKVFRQKFVAYKSIFKINFRKQDRRSKMKFTNKFKERKFELKNQYKDYYNQRQLLYKFNNINYCALRH